MSKVLGITLARGGSKDVPRKNIRDLAGIPLLAHTILEVRRCQNVDEYVISTDDREIAAVADEYNARVIMRPPHLATDTTPTLPCLLHAIEEVGGEWDIVADIRCTNPFKLYSDIDGAIEKLIRTDADAVIGVSRIMDGHPARLKRIFRDRLVDVWPEPSSGQRQDMKPEVYIRNGSLYIVKRDALEKGILIKLSDNVRPWIMPEERSVNIDTELDFLLAEVICANR
jgi:CMP-N,N'-diacetyllegionaminic acid synthase